MTCDYAGCHNPATTRTHGWDFCGPCLLAHQEVMRSDARVHNAVTSSRVGGFLLPSGSLDALLAALVPEPRAAGEPGVDEVAVDRRCTGDRTVGLSRVEAALAFGRLTADRLGTQGIADRLGVSARSVLRWQHGAVPKTIPAMTA